MSSGSAIEVCVSYDCSKGEENEETARWRHTGAVSRDVAVNARATICLIKQGIIVASSVSSGFGDVGLGSIIIGRWSGRKS